MGKYVNEARRIIQGGRDRIGRGHLVDNSTSDQTRGDTDRQIYPWDDQQVADAMDSGHLVWVWSRVLDEWVIWVLGEPERRLAMERHPFTAVYTLQELREMTQAGWTPEHLKQAHQAKRILGGAISCQ